MGQLSLSQLFSSVLKKSEIVKKKFSFSVRTVSVCVCVCVSEHAFVSNVFQQEGYFMSEAHNLFRESREVSSQRSRKL